MFPSPSPQDLSTIDEWMAAQLADTSPSGTVLPAHFQHSTEHRPGPLWLSLCQQVLVGGSAQWVDGLDQVAAWLTRADLRFEYGAADEAAAQPTLSPARVAALALGVGHPGHALGRQPASLSEALLADSLVGDWPPAGSTHLNLVQLLVGPWQRADGRGCLCQLELWCLPTDWLAQRPAWDPGPGTLVRAPGAVLLPVDQHFAQGLDRVQRLLRPLLRPGAPALAWNLRPMPEKGQSQAMPMSAVEGPSAIAMLAVASLYLLRGWLDATQPELARLAGWLEDLELPLCTLTAALDEPVAGGDAIPWPRLMPVGWVNDKFAALHRLPLGRHVARRYTAEPPADLEQPHWHLAEMIERMVRDLDPGLDDDARDLYRMLLDPTAPSPAERHMPLLERVARRGHLVRSVKGYLLWRYAVRASGSHAAFGDPVRLDQHFVRLVLTDPDRAPARQSKAPDAAVRDLSGAPGPDDADPLGELELDKLLDAPPHNAEPAWCVVSPPFHGKTTLLAKREADQAVQALRRRQAGGPWGEVCVFLPMRAFKLKDGVHSGMPDALEQQFLRFIEDRSPGLPSLSQSLALPSAQREEATHGLQWRLLIDGLNELSVTVPRERLLPGQSELDAALDERRQVVQVLCGWLARHRTPLGPLLPPVFTVRERENGFTLAAPEDDAASEGWRARLAAVRPWQRSDWLAYLDQRRLPQAAHERLHKALRLHRHDSEGQADDSVFEAFCRSPGILAAQCTVLERWPDLAPLTQRGALFGALLWHCLDRRGKDLSTQLWPERLRRPEVLTHAMRDGWRLPADPGPLLQHLMLQADAMQDQAGLPSEEVPAHSSPPQPLGDTPAEQRAYARAWRQAVQDLGLMVETHGGGLAFVHQQWQELFAAWGCGQSGIWPRMPPPALHPAPGQALLDHLERGGKLELPRDSVHLQRMRFAVQLARQPAALLRRLVLMDPPNLALAAQCAIDVRDVLEPDGCWRQPHPVLQHIRRLLLLASVDAGEAVAHKLRAAAVLGDHVGQAALAEDMTGDPEDVPGFDDAELNAHWLSVWAAKCQGEGVDIRLRLQMGFLLGHLQDTLRYTWVEAQLPDGKVHSGLVPRLHQWAMLGEYGGPRLAFRIGSDGEGDEDERPSWLKDLRPFQMARHPVTVGEWASFAQDAPGPDSQREGYAQLERFNNPLQPAIGVEWRQCMAYAAWAEPLHRALERRAAERANGRSGWTGQRLKLTEGWRSRVPTEVCWEAGVRGPARPGQTQPRWAHEPATSLPGRLDFNHDRKFDRTSPVGCYSASHTPSGVADSAGQVWEWCANALWPSLRQQGYRTAQAQAAADQADEGGQAPEWHALRGGALDVTAAQCRASYRFHRGRPDYLNLNIGVRLVRVWPPHSEP
ncbi:SUMF1/EgtB/PvdO family nonheme iron enzyme [Ideonella sp. 4Y16]|uniref:SUMF1/EgtB/PvdO family nonheme iron enzyme n=1 Tax=Ideonella alba TaxID=2824118 RepID=UPI001B38A818|nr:SUMF1/EgtB/PvdO family nonheme iron enzyme [Ideonella alba]MBQ0942265.1 SUMF1/EgtB/PvdO family nonheme iron enzyme [Ideonella alba]